MNDPGHAARVELMERIGDFLIGHGLAISPRNLVIAQAAFSGANLNLGRKIMERELNGESITQAWLDDIAGGTDGADGAAEMEAMVNQIAQSLSHFADTAREATQVTSTYNCAMEEHARSIEEMDGPVDILALTRLTRSMIEHTWRIEENMRKSEQEAAGLRQSLDRARKDAGVDYLTGLPNRRAFEAVFDSELRAAQQNIENLTIAFCDIDHFKAINDTHGHDTGDRVIQAVADLFAQIAGSHCHVARHGGEEFVLLFRGMNCDAVFEKLDRAREGFAERRLVNRETQEPIGHVTFSGGIANVFDHDDPRNALKSADHALYEAKHGGRNRIVIAGRG